LDAHHSALVQRVARAELREKQLETECEQVKKALQQKGEELDSLRMRIFVGDLNTEEIEKSRPSQSAVTQPEAADTPAIVSSSSSQLTRPERSPLVRIHSANLQLRINQHEGRVIHPGDNSWRSCSFDPPFASDGTSRCLNILHVTPLARIFVGVVVQSMTDRLTQDNTFVGTIGFGTRNDYARCNRKDVRPILGTNYPAFNVTGVKVLVTVDFRSQQIRFDVNETPSIFQYEGGPPLVPGECHLAVSLQAGCIVQVE
jgi:hypothetical protein